MREEMTFNEWLVRILNTEFHGRVSEFAKAVDVSKSSVRAYLGNRIVPYEDTIGKIIETSGEKMPPDVFEDYKGKLKQAKRNSGFGTRKKETLCWECSNAVPDSEHGCSWSRYFIPVEGWKAKPSRVDNSHSLTKVSTCSFLVYECPLFERDTDDCLSAALEHLQKNDAEDAQLREIKKADDAARRKAYLKSAQQRYYYKNRKKLCRASRERYMRKKMKENGGE